MASSLKQLLSEEGFSHSKFLTGQKQAKLRDESIPFPVYTCHEFHQTNLDSINHNKSGNGYYSSDSVSKGDESASDEVAVKAVISLLSGYIGRYVRDSIFQEIIRNKCKSCLERKTKDLDDGLFTNLEMGMERIDKLVQDQVERKELRMKSLRNSIQLMNSAVSLSSDNSTRNGATCGIPNSHISACAHLYLSIAIKLQKNDRISAWHLLQVFSDSPFLARTHLLPDLWHHLFLPHLLHLKVWYHRELETLSNSQQLDKEKRMKALSKGYNQHLDLGTIQFALYYREWLKVRGMAPPHPTVPLPSRPSSAPSRRRSSDSFNSHSSINRYLYQAVFGPTSEHQLVELKNQKKDSMDAWPLTEEKLQIEEDDYKNCNYTNNKVRTRQRSSSLDYTASRNEVWPEKRKSLDSFRFFTCQSVVSECLVKGNRIVRSNSINNVEYTGQTSNPMSRAIHTICLSDSLSDCEIAIRVITKSLLDSHGNPVVGNALSKPPLIEGILEVLFASDDDEILELGISILVEFVARNEANRLIILNSDPQLEIFIRLLRSSSLFLKAAVLLYHLKPKAKQMISIEWVALALRVLEFGDQLQTLFTVRCMPRKAAIYFLDELLTGFSDDKNLENASQVVSLGGLSFLLWIFEKGDVDERNNAAMLMSCCIQAEGSCRNYLAENVNKNSLLELIALGILKKSNGPAFTLLTDTLFLNRIEHIRKLLTELNNGWNGLNTKHIFLVCLQRALPEERPLVAAILLQLDILGDPLRSSLYREDAVEAIIEALNCQICNSPIQEQSAKALSMLGSRILYQGQASEEDWLLQTCQDRSVDLMEDEKALEDWQRRLTIALLNSGGKKFLEALSNSIANGTPSLVESCLYTIAWMNRALHLEPSEIAAELAEFSDYERAFCPTKPPSELEHLIKSSECVYAINIG